MVSAVTRWTRLSWLLVPAGAVWAWLAVREQRGNDRPWSFVLSMLLPGLLMIGSGLVIWRRRPHNRCWWLLVAAGFAWYVGEFEHARNPDISLGAFAFGRWYDLFLGWALIAFPTGRLYRRHDRLLVIALTALLSVRSLSRLFLHVPPDVAGYGTRNRFLPINDDRWWRTVEDVFGWGFAVTIGLLALSMADRWRRSSQPGRRMLSPALIGTVILAAAVVYEHGVGWSAGLPRAEGLRIYHVVMWLHGAVAVALAVGFVRLGQTRSDVVDLVAELGHDAPPARLEDALGRALGDADLSLLPWSATAGGYVDDAGRVVDLSSEEPNRAVTRIERRGEPVAAIVHDAALLEDPGLVNAVIAAVRLTIDNEHLQTELQSQLAEVAASRVRIVAAGDEERRRIERDLHDGAQQRLVAIALSLRLSETALPGDADPEVRRVLSRTVTDLREAIDELRALARGIHPAILESGIRAALESLVGRSPLPVQLDLRLDGEPSSTVTATAYFAVSEALTNIVKHANAHKVTVRAVASDGMIHIEVTDDGIGGADDREGSGLRGISDRVSTIGGSLRVHSPPGGGTRFEMDLPCVSS